LSKITPPLKWLPIPGFSKYRACSDGSIWSKRQLKPDRRITDGRKRYTLTGDDGVVRRRYGSYFILISFVGPCPDGMEACHNDGDCTNDSASNLRWDTHSANLLNRQRHGMNVKGEMINTAKLCADNVREIRRIGMPLKQHARKYGVSEQLISLIIRRKVWKHV